METPPRTFHGPLMCRDKCPDLSDVYRDNFEELDSHYEYEGRGRKSRRTRDLWFLILDAQMVTGTPFNYYSKKQLHLSS